MSPPPPKLCANQPIFTCPQYGEEHDGHLEKDDADYDKVDSTGVDVLVNLRRSVGEVDVIAIYHVLHTQVDKTYMGEKAGRLLHCNYMYGKFHKVAHDQQVVFGVT